MRPRLPSTGTPYRPGFGGTEPQGEDEQGQVLRPQGHCPVSGLSPTEAQELGWSPRLFISPHPSWVFPKGQVLGPPGSLMVSPGGWVSHLAWGLAPSCLPVQGHRTRAFTLGAPSWRRGWGSHSSALDHIRLS